MTITPGHGDDQLRDELVQGGWRALPRERIGDEPMPPTAAYEAIRADLELDGSARLNLATFVTTSMEPQAKALMAECMDKNMIDKDEYPQTADIEQRCVNILADLWHAETPATPTGCSTVGSSEACMLGGLALKHRWRARVGDDLTRRPNLVLGANAQICWDKFCRYFEVEPRLVPLEGDRLHLDADSALKYVDENTIGVVAILGSTMDGSYEPVAEIASALDKLAANGGPDIPIHVDAASGGFIAPFIDPGLQWDFRIPRVASINASGHKFGLVYPGVGWAIWRNQDALPQDLVFNVNYLGGNMPTFALNFSRPGMEVVGQYFMFTRLGREGFRVVQQAARDVAGLIAENIDQMPQFELLSRGDETPVVTFTTTDAAQGWDVFAVSRGLRERGWQVPAYTMPKNREDLAVLRIVCRNGLTSDLADWLLRDLHDTVATLAREAHTDHELSGKEAFHH
ncbi:glutamate decarboxylase [Rudaeicoccus suwonensis]|uniref:Glutamate decarboxylase n=1 Tax=Rudaeicoccus suwonensis TaxID=657409 RepID=A0A561EC75_9MICO|nr:glutamate decarboxylase [Rudaeicoccus suwonensis]TWE13210.1 glutamate decarboxylase [Rudaeicoccus suwonensis]